MKMIKKPIWIAALVLALAGVIAGSGVAGVYVYPNKGQSADRQGRDEYECNRWAVQNTGIDPTRPAPSSGYASRPAPPSALGTAARGAALGAIGGAIGGNAGKGAAIGAAVGGIGGGIRRRRYYEEERRRAQAAQSQQQAMQQEYYRAYAACLSGRGYTVR